MLTGRKDMGLRSLWQMLLPMRRQAPHLRRPRIGTLQRAASRIMDRRKLPTVLGYETSTAYASTGNPAPVLQHPKGNMIVSQTSRSAAERRLAIARRLYQAFVAQDPDRAITLCDGGSGLRLATIRCLSSVIQRLPHLFSEDLALTSHARADIKSRDDAPDYSLDLLLGAVTVADVAQPRPLIASSSLRSSRKGFARSLGFLRTQASLARKCCAVLRSLRRTT